MPPARRSARNTSSTAARESAHPYTRANRQTSPPRSSASIARPANGKTSLRLTVKAAPSKLRQATSGSQIASIPPNPYADASESDATPAPAVRTVRATRNPRTVVEPESDEEEDEEEEQDEDEGMDDEEDDEGEEQDEDAEGEDEELEDAEESEEDAEDDEDEDMSDAIAVQEHPPPPIIKTSNAAGRSKPNVTVTAPEEGAMKSVEEKEMDEEDDEQELSELDSNENEEEEEEEEGDDDLDSDDDEGSRSATPDLSKLTRRQRGIYEEEESTGLMSLSNEAQKKKHLTAEEHAMRRAEMARRRKNLSEKRNEEEKMDTINKLLKKPAPKRRTRAEIIAQQQADSMATPGAEEGEEERADPLFVRYVQNKSGARIGVPDEWMDPGMGEVGDVLGRGWSGSGRMVEEVV